MKAIRKRAYDMCVRSGALSMSTHPMIASRKPTKIWIRGPFRLIMFDETYPIFLLPQNPDIRSLIVINSMTHTRKRQINPDKIFFIASAESLNVEIHRKFVPDLTFTDVP
jgi:hypothetical protein